MESWITIVIDGKLCVQLGHGCREKLGESVGPVPGVLCCHLPDHSGLVLAKHAFVGYVWAKNWHASYLSALEMVEYVLSTCQYLCTIPANSRHNKMRPSSTKLCWLHRETGMKTIELVVSQDREVWRELVVACVDLQPPDYRERERERDMHCMNLHFTYLLLPWVVFTPKLVFLQLAFQVGVRVKHTGGQHP